MKTKSLCWLLFLVVLVAPAFSEPLKEARINQIVNDVKVVEPSKGARPASLQELIKDDLGVATGVQSRAELLFQDNTLTRLGAETFFSFQPGTRNINVERGTMLLQVPKNQGGARIRAASVCASITGTTIMVEHQPGKRLKILVLEGSLRVGVDARPGESVLLNAGKMVVMSPDAKELPKPVDVDLHKLVRTSALINPVLFKGKSNASVAALPSMGLIEKEVAQQQATPIDHALVAANIEQAAADAGNVQLSAFSGDALTASIAKTELALPPNNLTADATDPHSTAASSLVAVPSNSANGTQYPSGPAFVTSPSPYLIGNYTTFNTASQTVVTSEPPPSTQIVTNAGGLYAGATVSGPASQYLFGSTSAFDTASDFNTRFSIQDQGSAPSEGVAVYRFSNLQINDAPILNLTGGPVDLALVSQQSMSSSGGAWHLDSLRSLFMGTVDGSISLAGNLQAQSNSGFKYLQLYARGAAGSVTLAGGIDLQGASLFVNAQAGIHEANGSSVNVNKAVFNTPGAVVLDSGLHATLAQINAGSSIQINQNPNLVRLEATAPLITIANDLQVTSGFLKIGAGGIQAGTRHLTGFDTIDSLGGLEAGNVTANTYVHVKGELTTAQNNGQATISAPDISFGGGINFNGANNSNGGNLTLQSTNINISTTGINGITANGADAISSMDQGRDGGTVNIGSNPKPIANNVTVAKPISATTGANGSGVTAGGNGGTVNVVANGAINVNSSIKVSDSIAGRASKQGGKITLTSNKTAGTAIAVNNSGQLLALLNAASTGNGGTIQFVSAGGDILVNGGKVQADKGTVQIQNNGAGNVSLTNATISADVVKVAAMGPNGQLNVGGGTISADSLLELYANSSNGQVHFTGNVTLGGAGTKIIAGEAVTIDSSKTVTIGGSNPASVYTDHANYSGSGGNGSTSGKFGGAGATTQAFNNRPGF